MLYFLSGGRVPWLKCALTDSQKDAPLTACQSCCFMRAQHQGCVMKNIFGIAIQAK